jgi:hypothetical protein
MELSEGMVVVMSRDRYPGLWSVQERRFRLLQPSELDPDSTWVGEWVADGGSFDIINVKYIDWDATGELAQEGVVA